MAQRVHRRADEHRARPYAALARRCRGPGAAAEFAHECEQFLDVDARRDFFQRAETHDAIVIYYERGRESDAAFFCAVEQVIRFDDFAAGVA